MRALNDILIPGVHRCLFAVLCALALGAQAQTTVEAFSPAGTVKQVRQVTARFSAPMVAFGDLRLLDPFDVDCPEKGSGRWIDGRNWSYDFVRDLPAGLQCRFSLKRSLSDLAARPLAGQSQFAFSTGGPAIIGAMPHEGQRPIDENQVFVLELDAAVNENTVAAHASCRAEGVNEQIGVRVIGGEERKRILAPSKRRGAAKPLAIVQCKRGLPADAKVSLVWGAGIATPGGVANTQDQVLAYKTRPDFTARFSCDRVNATADCIPFLPMQLAFSAPIAMRDARAIVLVGPDGKRYAPAFALEAAKAEHVDRVEFKGPFPELAQMQLLLPPGLKDDAGRSLLNGARFPIAVRTAEQPPLVKFAARFGIVEARGERLLPVTVRNVEASLAGRMQVTGKVLRTADQQDQEAIDWVKRLAGGHGGWRLDEQYNLEHAILGKLSDPAIVPITLPRPNGRRAFEVIGIPLPKPGFYVVELASPKLGAALNKGGGTAYVHAAALVTNLAAHFKRGAESSLVWVTSLDKGRPVAKAKVAVRDCAGKLLWQGTTGSSGVASIAQELPQSACSGNFSYFISARSGEDFSFTLSDWQSGIEPWRFGLPTGSVNADATLAATVLDRSLLRAGETVHMKHFLRKHTAAGIALVREGDKLSSEPNWQAEQLGIVQTTAQPDQVFVVHQGSSEKTALPVKWSAGGTAEQDWKIPAGAKLGRYDVFVGGREAGHFRVEQFRVPTMKALLIGPKAPAVQASALDLDLQLNYLSGGGASLAPVKLRTLVQDKGVSFPGYEEFSFSAGDVKEGVEQEIGGFDDEDSWEQEGDEESAGSTAAKTRSLVLDKAGGARVRLDQLPKVEQPQDLLAELSYQDANGETLSVSTRIPLWPSNYLVGIKPDDWALSKDALKFQVVVLDVAGKPVSDTQVAVDFFQRQNYSHRRRMTGGFYSYENSSEVKRLGLACEGRTDARGLLSCEGKAPADGNLILRAVAADEQGRRAVTRQDVWVAGSADWWFKASDNDRIDLLPSSRRYEPGQEATFQVRSPFRDATVLVTVEREGILDTYVRKLSGKSPTFTIPVKGSYAPNVFVSALVVRGRVGDVQPTALVDLGKPAYKLGITQMRVGWRAHELKVQVAADKTIYKVREKAEVMVKVTRADGKALPGGSEVALAAVDVGLLELMPNTSWDLLEAMMRERSLQVETSTSQMQVIGKRHFGRKAFPHGGGGGKGGSRELFDTLLFWKARVSLDANGEARVQVPLNDSLTAFRIVAIASGGADLFGSGRTDIQSSQDVILMSGLPALVREGDRFRAGFTLRNTSAGELRIDLGASVAGHPLVRQALTLGAGQAQELGWNYTVPAGLKNLVWEVDAKAIDAAGLASSDKLRVSQTVGVAVPVRTQQATLVQIDRPQAIKVQMPAEALAGRGGVLTTFSARLGGDLPGVREYMAAYPYTCFEQLSSRAVALRDAALWTRNMASLPAHLDGDGLVKYFPLMSQGSDTLTAYILSIAQEAGYTIPAQLKERMQEGLALFVQGKVVRHSELATADLAVRKVAALEALSHAGRVTQESLESFSIEPELWPTSAVIDWYLILQRTPSLARRDAQLAQVQQILRSRLNLQGTTMGFSTERSDQWWWLMVSSDVNANRLLLAMLDNPAWQGDMGRMARGALGRQLKGRWSTTPANAWGVLAIEKFSKKFESIPVTGSSSARLGSQARTVDWAAPAAPAVLQAWPKGADDLALSHTGTGKPWAIVQSLAAVPLKAPLSSGYKVVKTITPVEQKVKGEWSRGDVYRVRLDMEAQGDMTWVVVDDPIPASASLLGTGLGRDSQIMTAGEKLRGWVWPTFEERSFEAYRAYYQFVPKGKWSVEYTVRLNNLGRFVLPATRIEAMYSPEMFGEIPNAAIGVGP